MELFSDNPELAAVALTRLAAGDTEGRGHVGERLEVFIEGLVERNGLQALEELAIGLARQHLSTLERLAELTGRPAMRLLDEVELQGLEKTWDKGTTRPEAKRVVPGAAANHQAG